MPRHGIAVTWDDDDGPDHIVHSDGNDLLNGWVVLTNHITRNVVALAPGVRAALDEGLKAMLAECQRPDHHHERKG